MRYCVACTVLRYTDSSLSSNFVPTYFHATSFPDNYGLKHPRSPKVSLLSNYVQPQTWDTTKRHDGPRFFSRPLPVLLMTSSRPGCCIGSAILELPLSVYILRIRPDKKIFSNLKTHLTFPLPCVSYRPTPSPLLYTCTGSPVPDAAPTSSHHDHSKTPSHRRSIDSFAQPNSRLIPSSTTYLSH